MSGRASKRKGSNAEREVAKLFTAHGFSTKRTPYSGASFVKGDLIGSDLAASVDGYHFEVKRCESILMPKWLRQSYADAGVNTPTVVFRRSRAGNDPLGFWHIALPLDSWLSDQAELRQLRRERAA